MAVAASKYYESTVERFPQGEDIIPEAGIAATVVSAVAFPVIGLYATISIAIATFGLLNCCRRTKIKLVRENSTFIRKYLFIKLDNVELGKEIEGLKAKRIYKEKTEALKLVKERIYTGFSTVITGIFIYSFNFCPPYSRESFACRYLKTAAIISVMITAACFFLLIKRHVESKI